MSRGDTLAFDGFGRLTGGMDGGDPVALDGDQAALLINYQLKDEFIETRPGFVKRTLLYDQDAELEANFEDNRFQGAAPHAAFGGRDQSSIVCAIGGRHFAIGVSDGRFKVTDISISGDLGANNCEQVWMVQAEDFMVSQDGQARPFIWAGSSSFRSRENQFQSGRMMAYGLGRLWGCDVNQHTFVAGDLIYGDQGTGGFGKRDSVLYLTENTFLNEGGRFSVGANTGGITAMIFASRLDSSLGEGPLLVGTQKALYSINAPINRDTWKDLQYPIQTIGLIGNGPVSQDATVNVNGDVWYRSADGVRSFIQGRREFNTWANTPMSEEVNAILSKDSPGLIKYSSAVYWDNKYILTFKPERVAGRGVCFEGLLVLDFSPVSRLRRGSSPAWVGVWTGLRVLKILTMEVKGVERCFLVVLTRNDEKIELYEIDRDAYEDEGGTRIVSEVVTKSMGWPDEGQRHKELATADVWPDHLWKTVDFDLKYRHQGYPLWTDWVNWQECVGTDNCSPGCDSPTPILMQSRRPRFLPEPPHSCDSADNRSTKQGYRFQAKLTTTGHTRLRQARFGVRYKDAPVETPCRSASADCETIADCGDSLFDYTLA